MNCCTKPKTNSPVGSEHVLAREREAECEEAGEEEEEEGEGEIDYSQSGNCMNPFDKAFSDLSLSWFPSQHKPKSPKYVQKLEKDYAGLQQAFLMLTTHYARMQFRLRQIFDATPGERKRLLSDLEKIVFEAVDSKNYCSDEMPYMQRDVCRMGNIRRKQNDVIAKLRGQLSSLYDASKFKCCNIIRCGSDNDNDDDGGDDGNGYCDGEGDADGDREGEGESEEDHPAEESEETGVESFDEMEALYEYERILNGPYRSSQFSNSEQSFHQSYTSSKLLTTDEGSRAN